MRNCLAGHCVGILGLESGQVNEGRMFLASKLIVNWRTMIALKTTGKELEYNRPDRQQTHPFPIAQEMPEKPQRLFESLREAKSLELHPPDTRTRVLKVKDG